MLATIRHALDTLEQRQVLAKEATAILKSNSSHDSATLYSARFEKIYDELIEETNKVRHLELRVTVVASMKSGKSTIINALVGENILPTRANAMTIIPTEVIFKSDARGYTLLISNEIISAIGTVREEIRNLLNEAASSGPIHELFQNEEHMVTLAQQIMKNAEANNIFLPNRVVDPIEIQNTLLNMNDIIRLYLKLATQMNVAINERNFQAFQNRIPRVEVPLPSEMTVGANVGNLIIVDTPGPNEAEMSKQLHEIVTRELRKASIILVVFNYTTLNTNADEQIMNEIVALRKICPDDDSLYAVVNKVDQRRKGDMSRDDVRKFISSRFAIQQLPTTNDNDQRIFETKAVYGLTAKRFLIEYDQLKRSKTDFTPASMQTVDDLGNELYAFDWEDIRETIEVEQLRKGAEDLWNKSGLATLLQTTMNGLVKTMSANLIRSALEKCQRADQELVDCLTSRQKALDGDRGKLNNEMLELKKEMALIENIRSHRFSAIESFLTTMKDELKAFSSLPLQSIDEVASKWEKPVDWKCRVLDSKFTSGVVIGGVVTTTTVAAGLSAGIASAGVPLAVLGLYHWFWGDTSDAIYIENEPSAVAKFEHDATDIVCQVLDKFCHRIQYLINTTSQQLANDLHNSVQNTVSDLLHRARQVINSPYEIKCPVFHEPEIKYDRSTIKIELEENSNPIHRKYKFILRRQKLLDQFEKSIQENVKRIQQSLEQWSHHQLQKEVEIYLRGILDYLDRYMNIVKSSFNDANLSTVEQDKIRKNIQQLIDKINTKKKHL